MEQETITQFDDKCMTIKTHPKSIERRGSLYRAIRRCWETPIEKAQQADYVLAVVGANGKVVEVYKPEHWCYFDEEFYEKIAEDECKKFNANTDWQRRVVA